MSGNNEATQELAEVMADSLRPYLGMMAQPAPAEMFTAVQRAMARLDSDWVQHIAVEADSPVVVGEPIPMRLRALTSYGAKLLAAVQAAVEQDHLQNRDKNKDHEQNSTKSEA